MTSLFQYLQDTLKVNHLDDGQLEVTVTLPREHYHHYAQLLDSLTGFVQIINRESKLAKSRAAADSEIFAQEAKQNLERYYARLVEAYDLYLSQGLKRNAAIKQISADLRAEKHPWSSPDLVRPSLIEAGRGGQPGRPRRQP